MTEVKRYRKRPVVVEAVEWDGTVEGATAVIDWVLANGGTARYHDWEPSKPPLRSMEPPYIAIDTLEGTAPTNSGDYVIKGIKGEFYPHAGSFFNEAFDEVLTDDSEIKDAIVRSFREV